MTAISVEKATQKFIKDLWAGAVLGDRKRMRESEGTDHYLESIHEIEGKIREWYHPQYGLSIIKSMASRFSFHSA